MYKCRHCVKKKFSLTHVVLCPSLQSDVTVGYPLKVVCVKVTTLRVIYICYGFSNSTEIQFDMCRAIYSVEI